MRVWSLLAILMLPGCVSELLGPPEITTRTVACAVLSPDMEVHVVQHTPSDAVPAAVLEEAVDAWMREMAAITGKTDDQFRAELAAGPDHDGPWTHQALKPWIGNQRVVSGDQVVLRVLWVDALPDPERAVQPLAPGFLLINATAWTMAVVSGQHGEQLAGALLYHGLGHLLGVVNLGIPLHERDGASREEPQHHEPAGVMSQAWHHAHTFPTNATIEYSEGIVGDWRHAQTSQAVCA